MSSHDARGPRATHLAHFLTARPSSRSGIIRVSSVHVRSSVNCSVPVDLRSMLHVVRGEARLASLQHHSTRWPTASGEHVIAVSLSTAQISPCLALRLSNGDTGLDIVLLDYEAALPVQRKGARIEPEASCVDRRGGRVAGARYCIHGSGSPEANTEAGHPYHPVTYLASGMDSQEEIATDTPQSRVSYCKIGVLGGSMRVVEGGAWAASTYQVLRSRVVSTYKYGTIVPRQFGQGSCRMAHRDSSDHRAASAGSPRPPMPPSRRRHGSSTSSQQCQS